MSLSNEQIAEHKSNYQKRHYERMKRSGMCVRCCHSKAIAGQVLCEECKARVRDYRTQYMSDPGVRDYNNRKMQMLFKDRQDNHQCKTCGIQLPEDSTYVTCESCRAKRNAREKERRRKKREGKT